MLRQCLDNLNFDFIRLLPSNKVKSFDCGDADLNDFILNRANLFDKHMLAVSYACVDINDASKLFAYFSLAIDKIATSDFPSGSSGLKRLVVSEAVPYHTLLYHAKSLSLARQVFHFEIVGN